LTREGETDMNSMITRVRAFLTQEDGQDLIEYALLAALIALAAVVAMKATGTSINGIFNSIQAQLNSSVPAAS
jgi:pilus assembly protein Flp/PilA